MGLKSKMKFEEKLYLLRTEKKISQSELAEILDVSRQAISKWEGGRAKPDTDHLILIGRYFDVSLDYLVNDDINDSNRKIYTEGSATSNKEQKKTGKYKKKLFGGIIIIVLLIAILAWGTATHSLVTASVLDFVIVIVIAVAIVYTRIRNLLFQAKDKEEGR